MKTKVREEERARRLPQVGEPWKHKQCGFIYLRIQDDFGQAWFGKVIQRPSDYFYSIDMENGQCVHTSVKDDTIVVLRPVNDVAEFEPAGT